MERAVPREEKLMLKVFSPSMNIPEATEGSLEEIKIRNSECEWERSELLQSTF